MSIWMCSEDTNISLCCSTELLSVCINPPWSTGECWDVCAFFWAWTRDTGILRCQLSFRCQNVLLLVTELKGPTEIWRSIWRDADKYVSSQLHSQLSARIETSLKQHCDSHHLWLTQGVSRGSHCAPKASGSFGSWDCGQTQSSKSLEMFTLHLLCLDCKVPLVPCCCEFPQGKLQSWSVSFRVSFYVLCWGKARGERRNHSVFWLEPWS